MRICGAIKILPLAAESRIAEMRKIKLGLSSLKDFERGYRNSNIPNDPLRFCSM
jgi:hypothetical protein